MLAPWAAAGFRCVAVDLQEPPATTHPGVEHVQCDVRSYLPPRGEYVAAFAFPPCTHLANSGARWWKSKGLGKLAEAIELVEACQRILEWTGAPYLLENPNGALSTHWRKPDHSFDPCDFGAYLNPPGDQYTKRTCLWVGGGFKMPAPKWVEPVEGSKMHTMADTPERANLRSETPKGFAQAVYEANAPDPLEPFKKATAEALARKYGR
jgi:hypothetical protein